ncbi:MAG: phytanoyl-CoA dioxygenase family protein [Proteobacteria bacterium]|nr:MAG: phytanoyl-CoA dioxygenase family protein [Pseudomonadota bacterium]
MQQLAESFARDGFVRVAGLLDPAEVERFAGAVERAVRERTARDRRTLAQKNRYEQSFLQCINLWEDYEAVRPLTFHPRICETAAALIGAARIRLWHDQALFKEPGGRETDAHQDQPYWPIAEPDTATAWIPLVDVDEEIGCMGYVPGSHAVGLRRFVDIFFGQPEDVLARPELRGAAPVFVPARRGDVLFHHGLTVHLAKPNRSSRMRAVHTAIFFRDGCTRADTKLGHPSVDRNAIAVGAPIAGDATPIAWPRGEDELPAPPAAKIRRRDFGRSLWPPSAIEEKEAP